MIRTWFVLVLLGLSGTAWAQAETRPARHSTASQAPATSGHGADDISEKLADPIANMISLPFQLNWDNNTGAGNDGDRLTLNVQPVIPITLNDEWLLITRTILPVIYQDEVLVDEDDTQFGLGDTQQSFFFSPKHSGIEHFKWGVGPIFLWPTATNDTLGTGKFGVGPSVIALYQKNPWTMGVLANHIWSFADVGDANVFAEQSDSDRPEVNQTFVQPFVNHQLGQGWSVMANVEATYNWTDEHWTVPFSTGVSKVTHLGKLPVSLGVQGRYWLEGPDGAPEWGARLVVTFVFPE